MTFDTAAVQQAVYDLLRGVGEDPTREGLADTPARVARAWAEMLDGYGKNAIDVLKTTSGENGFSNIAYDQMIVLAGYPMTSTCEHHMLPFMGHVDVGYIPGESGVVVGLSKLGRLVEMYAARLQVQERLTHQVADSLSWALAPLGVGVRVRSVHQCMTCRGVRKGGVMVTEALLGAFQDHSVRDEFWHLADSGGGA